MGLGMARHEVPLGPRSLHLEELAEATPCQEGQRIDLAIGVVECSVVEYCGNETETVRGWERRAVLDWEE